MKKYFLSGIFLGLAIPHSLSNYHFDVWSFHLLKPYQLFYHLKKESYKKDMGLDYSDYVNHISNIAKSFINFAHFYLIAYRRAIIQEKQNLTFNLIERFEFVRETIDNFDFVQTNLKKIEIEEVNNSVGSYAYMKKLEQEAKVKNKSVDDFNIENIQLIKEMAEDEYEKYLLENAIQKKEDYDKSLTPQFKLMKETNRLKLIEQYQDSLRKFKSEQMGDDLDIKARDVVNNATNIINRKINQEEIDNKKKIFEKGQLNVKEKTDQSKKYPTIKSIEGDLDSLKKLFGETKEIK
jgi:hypothetical protein